MPENQPKDPETTATPATTDEPRPPETLRELIAMTRPRGTARSRIQALVDHLAAVDGVASADELRRAGFPEAVILAAALQDPDDGRIKPRVATDFITPNDPAPMVWLTGAGWKMAGHPRRTERRPTTQTVEHANAPRDIVRAIQERARLLAGDRDPFVDVTLVDDPGHLKEFGEAASSRAWAAIQSKHHADTDGGIGLLTNGWRPDALLLERWEDLDIFNWLYGIDAFGTPVVGPQRMRVDGAAYNWRVALEVEYSHKSPAMLTDKLARAGAAIRVGAVDAVAWCVRDAATMRAIYRAAGQSLDSGQMFLPLYTLFPDLDPIHIPRRDMRPDIWPAYHWSARRRFPPLADADE